MAVTDRTDENRPGAELTALAAKGWVIPPVLAPAPRHGLVVTVQGVGDVEPGQKYASQLLVNVPMVTWFPAGSKDDRFCLAVVSRNAVNEPLHLVWLVVDIPGASDDDYPIIEPCCYGLAGNHAAVGRGMPAVPYEAPHGDTALLILLFEQQQHVHLGPHVQNLSRDAFDIAEFAQQFGLGAVKAAEMVDVSALPMLPQPTAEKPLAHSRGGNLTIDPTAPTTLTAALQRTAQVFPERGLTIYNTTGVPVRMSFSMLCSRALQISQGLTQMSMHDQPTMLQVPTISDHFAAFWGCLLCSTRPVTVAIPPNYANGAHAICGKIYNTWQLLECPPIITTSSHTEKVSLLRDSMQMKSLQVVTLERLAEAGLVLGNDRPHATVQVNDPKNVAFLQLSSGSTGVPKCIQITHEGVVAHIHGEAQFCDIGPDDVHLSFLPVDHVVPILTVHCCDVYHGCEEVQADVAWVVPEPLRWFQLLSKHRATRTWAPNFAFKLLADVLQRQPDLDEAIDLSHCRYWMNAGEQVTIPVCEDFLEQAYRFGVRRQTMQPSFGMAEACTCMTYNNEFETVAAARNGRSTFVNLGPPVPGVEIRITDDANQTVFEETVGRFQIRGAVVTPGYLRNEESNTAAFVGDGWFNTGDIGFIKDGRLYLTGREKEMIIIRGANFYCYEIEDVVNSLPCVMPTFTAAVAVHDPQTGTEGLAIFFVPRNTTSISIAVDELSEVIRDVRSTLVRHMGLTANYILPLLQDEFPKTTSGKIQRNKLAEGLRAGVFDARLQQQV